MSSFTASESSTIKASNVPLSKTTLNEESLNSIYNHKGKVQNTYYVCFLVSIISKTCRFKYEFFLKLNC